MLVVDVNVLIALFRDDAPAHRATRRWWRDQVASEVAVTVPDLVWVGFVRIVTNPKAFPVPAPVQRALAWMDEFTAQPNYQHHPSSPRGLAAFAATAVEADARANLITDAYVAGVARALGASVATYDRDFRKFDGLRVVEPVAG